jgi:hypothetical protein
LIIYSGVVFWRFIGTILSIIGIYSSGCFCTCGTLSEISFPTRTKKLLNSFEISAGISDGCPFIFIFGIEFSFCFLPISSFKIFQVSFGFF